jgi:hypothetical protein
LARAQEKIWLKVGLPSLSLFFSLALFGTFYPTPYITFTTPSSIFSIIKESFDLLIMVDYRFQIYFRIFANNFFQPFGLDQV